MWQGHPRFYVIEEMVAVSFTLPKVRTEFEAFFRANGIKVLQEMQHDDFPKFEFSRFTWQENFVSRYISQYPLLVLGQCFIDMYPLIHITKVKCTKSKNGDRTRSYQRMISSSTNNQLGSPGASCQSGQFPIPETIILTYLA